MSSFLSNRSLSFKLALVCWVPVVALLVISMHEVYMQHQSWRDAQSIGRVLDVAPVMSNLVHDLQRERGTSAGYVGSDGRSFGDQIDGLRTATDRHLAEMDSEIDAISGKLAASGFVRPYERALNKLSALADIREKVSAKAITVPELAGYYTGVISDLLEAIEDVKSVANQGNMMGPISAYTALMYAKESAGLERAMGAVGFGSGHFNQRTYQRFISLNAKQDFLLDQFRKSAPASSLVMLSNLQNNRIEERVRGYREVARRAPFGGHTSTISGGDWWDATTARIDALKDIEDELAQTLGAQTVKNAKQAFATFTLFGTLLSGLVVGAALVSIMVYREIQPPIARIIKSMRCWSERGTIADLPEAARHDDIGELARTFNDLRHRLEETRAIEQERTDKERAQTLEMKLLSDLNEWLQSSTSTGELYDMVETFMTQLLPECSGSLYVYSNSRDVLDGACAWNGGGLEDHIRPDDCWSLRRGRGYSYKSGDIKFACEHTKPHDESPYSCLPILAHGETVGMMHLRPREGVSEEQFFEHYRLAQLAAEQISLAIANSKMRDQLHQQSIRDPLTGLYNRRHFIDVLRRQIEVAKRSRSSFALASIDVDHFKRFNDNHGHDAGDMVLRAVGSALENECDGDEMPCRIGGEEFMLLIPNSSVEEAADRAEQVRKLIEKISVRYGEKTLPKITISVGLAGFPDHGSMPQDLMKLADDALYRSKAAGRNQVSIATTSEEADQKSPLVDFEKVKEELTA